MFSGIFIARYRVELVLATPLICATMAYYFNLGFRRDSPVQRPEKLYKSPRLMGLAAGAFILSAALLFIDLPFVSQLFRHWSEWQSVE